VVTLFLFCQSAITGAGPVAAAPTRARGQDGPGRSRAHRRLASLRANGGLGLSMLDDTEWSGAMLMGA